MATGRRRSPRVVPLRQVEFVIARDVADLIEDDMSPPGSHRRSRRPRASAQSMLTSEVLSEHQMRDDIGGWAGDAGLADHEVVAPGLKAAAAGESAEISMEELPPESVKRRDCCRYLCRVADLPEDLQKAVTAQVKSLKHCEIRV